jgi:hypothetical protein
VHLLVCLKVLYICLTHGTLNITEVLVNINQLLFVVKRDLLTAALLYLQTSMVKRHDSFEQGPTDQLEPPYLKRMKFRKEVSFTYSKKVHSLTNCLHSLTGQSNNLCFDNAGITNIDKNKT